MIKTIAAAALLAALLPASALAQDTMNTADTTMTAPVSQDDDDDFPWGLLGLLGLAGLMGRKRDRDDVRVDTSKRM